MLRTAAFETGMISTDVDTETYIFLASVIQQGTAPTMNNPTGGAGTSFPASWVSPDGTYAARYNMDPAVVSAYSSQIINDLKAVPTLSIVTTVNDMFGPNQVYNSGQTYRGITAERACSAELIYPDDATHPNGSTAFQIDAGIRLYGNVGAQHNASLKNSFRLRFDDPLYGAGKLDYDIFDSTRLVNGQWGAVPYASSGTDQFDTIILRAAFNNGFLAGSGTYLNDFFSAETQLAMGDVASHGTFVQLYVNGLYWGLYNPMERPDASFMASYFGGEKADYDVNHEGQWIAGDATAWNALNTIINGANIALPATFYQLQGLNPDGTPNPSYPDYLDMNNLIDYVLMNWYGSNWDWDGHNYYFGRNRNNGPFRFFNWDGEGNLSNTDNITTADRGAITHLVQRLKVNPEFCLRFADRADETLFNDGALTAGQAQARWSDLMAWINGPIVGESARWGSTSKTQTTWLNACNSINSGLPSRTTNLISWLKADGLYPSSATLAAPEFSQHGGYIGVNFNLSISNPGGQGVIYYTLDDSDPRLPLGTVNSTAHNYTGSAFHVDGGTWVNARIKLSDGSWSPLTRTQFLSNTSDLRITEVMYNPAPPTAAENPAGTYTADDYEYVELCNTGTSAMNLSGVHFDAGINFTFPSYQLGAGAYVIVAHTLAAFALRYPGVNSSVVLGPFGLGTDGLITQLSNSGEEIVLATDQDLAIEDFTYNDSWYSWTDGGGYSLVAIDPAPPTFPTSTPGAQQSLQRQPGRRRDRLLQPQYHHHQRADDLPQLRAGWLDRAAQYEQPAHGHQRVVPGRV